jgi:sec-independent protein translocase protein TatA
MVPLAVFPQVGLWEILLILLIVIVLFGARRIPELARGLGEGIRGFRTSLRGEDEEPKNSDASGNGERRAD